MGPQPINYLKVQGPTSLREAQEEYPRLWATIRRDFHVLSEAKQLQIIALLLGVCHSCHDNETGCRCWDDE